MFPLPASATRVSSASSASPVRLQGLVQSISIMTRGAAVLALGLLLAACGKDGTSTVNPTPGIASLEPTQLTQGSGETTIQVLGSDFVRSSEVRFKGAARPTQFVGRSELRATLTAADLATAGTATIVVVNPEPGGGTSNPMQIVIGVAQNPAPTLASLSPGSAVVGSPATTVTLTGTGFVAQSRVIVGNFQERPTTWVSATQLRVQLSDSLLAAGGTLQLRVLNPAPGGGASTFVPFEVRMPQPAITSLGTTQTAAGQPPLVLRVNGTGFAPGSTVHVNGTAVPTAFVNAGALDATLGENLLRAPGTLSVTVVNGGPGGGTSAALSLQVVAATPEITLLPSAGASAGRPGFTLYVHGRGFIEGTVVRWNGAERPTQYLSGTRLSATISSADVAAPGTAQITVQSAGGTSAAAAFTVRAVGAGTITSQHALPIPGRDLVYDPGTSRLYVTVRASAGTNPNSVAAVNPSTGAVADAAFVGSEPGRIARSDDGQFLYVGLNGASAVRRVALATLAPGLQWSLPAGEVAGDLEVLPGRPRSVAVSRQRPGYSPPLEGVTIYDDGAARPQSSPGHTGGNRIEVLESASVLYGYNNAHTGFEFFTMGVDATGVRHSATTGGLVGGFYTDIVGESGRIYGTDGSIVDAERRVRLGSIGGGIALAVDPRLGRAFVLTESGIRVYDLNTFQLLGSVAVSGGFEHPALLVSRLVRWGNDGVAFLDEDQLFIVRSPLFGP